VTTQRQAIMSNGSEGAAAVRVGRGWGAAERAEAPGRRVYPAPEELCRLDNVILSPHSGGATW
jgi:hypothetical protein